MRKRITCTTLCGLRPQLSHEAPAYEQDARYYKTSVLSTYHPHHFLHLLISPLSTF
jgi:hypothetical protein